MDCVRGQEYEAALGIEVWSNFADLVLYPVLSFLMPLNWE